jgi:hypothetical protein
MTIPFGTGVNPTITIVDHSTDLPGKCDLTAMAAALEQYVCERFQPVYGMACAIRFAPKGIIPPGDWGLIIVNRSDEADALGYHDLTPDGQPQMIISVLDTLDADDTLEDVISHEVLETLVDPGTNIAIAVNAAQTKFVACEVCDPVQGEFVGVDGFKFAAFVFPGWFQWWMPPLAHGTKPGAPQFDVTGACRQPLQILKGGYCSRFRKGEWDETFGSKKAAKKFKRRAHARAARRRHGKKKLLSKRAASAQ